MFSLYGEMGFMWGLGHFSWVENTGFIYAVCTMVIYINIFLFLFFCCWDNENALQESSFVCFMVSQAHSRNTYTTLCLSITIYSSFLFPPLFNLLHTEHLVFCC